MSEPDAPLALGRGQRWLVGVIGVVLVVHTVLLALWLAPASPVRDEVGSTRLASYVDPYFRQSDQTVGIGSYRVDETLSLRAFVRPAGGGKGRYTGWTDVTTREARSDRGALNPTRADQVSRRLAANLNLALLQLSSSQRRVVLRATADMTSAELGASLRGAGVDDRAAENVAAQDAMVTRFASLWLGARYVDSELLAIQYRVGRRVVPSADDPAGSLGDVRWSFLRAGPRLAFRADPEARTAFDDFLTRADRD